MKVGLQEIKHNANESISKYKERLVAKGYAQNYGIDYVNSFSPVVRMATMRTIIAVAATKGWSLHQMDVKNAFLHGDFQEEVYMTHPQGYEDDAQPHFVCTLHKALYGLKQPPRAWLNKIHQYLVTIGFQISNAYFSLYVKKTKRGIVLIAIYIDDLIITRDSDADLCDVKMLLK